MHRSRKNTRFQKKITSNGQPSAKLWYFKVLIPDNCFYNTVETVFSWSLLFYELHEDTCYLWMCVRIYIIIGPQQEKVTTKSTNEFSICTSHIKKGTFRIKNIKSSVKSFPLFDAISWALCACISHKSNVTFTFISNNTLTTPAWIRRKEQYGHSAMAKKLQGAMSFFFLSFFLLTPI